MQAYKDDSSKTADKFLTDELLKGFPFDIKNFQIDRDSEFMNNFEQICQNNNIKVLVFTSRSLKLMAMSKRTLQEEYYLQNYNNLTTNISSLKIIAKQIQNHYNFVRLHRNLNFNIRFFSTMEFLHLSKIVKYI